VRENEKKGLENKFPIITAFIQSIDCYLQEINYGFYAILSTQKLVPILFCLIALTML